VIARDHITQWSVDAPWPERQQVEQDLVLSRLILEIASDPLLGGELEHPDFLADLNTLIVHQPGGYDILAAADLLMEHLGAHLKNAPSYAEITNGTWRE
jgi:hypothetical protein